MVGVLTRTGTFNAGLSYFYVEHIDKMSEARALIKRLRGLIKGQENDNASDARKLIDWLVRTTDLSSKHLWHYFYSRLPNKTGILCVHHL